MKIIDRFFDSVLLLEPTTYRDDRGIFFESYNHIEFEKVTGKTVNFVQDNQSISTQGVLRGLHAQRPPFEQGKLLQVMSGVIYDVVVDLRPNSPTYYQWRTCTLNSEQRQLLWIPEGFAHGFYVLSDNAHVFYKTTRTYAPEHEFCISWNDVNLAIDWPLIDEPILSAKDSFTNNI